jgi:hypothetical protein
VVKQSPENEGSFVRNADNSSKFLPISLTEYHETMDIPPDIRSFRRITENLNRRLEIKAQLAF